MPSTPREILSKYWGYPSFRSMQEEIISEAIRGNDVVALLPTGGGKSLCYQVPGLAMPGLTLVVSPLIALMRDQVEQLKRRNIKAAAIYSGMSRREIDIVLDNCVYGDFKFLYVSPERLQTEVFRERLKKMNVNLVAIDEAHCISLWGYDFRPPYMQIAELRDFLPEVPFMALTATATKQVQADIIEKLKLNKPALLSRSFARVNISYTVRESFEKEKSALNILQKVNGTAIIYVNTRKMTRDVVEFLLKNGVSADFYHAGLSDIERARKQQAWIRDQVRVMVATNAFGMGIDKPDVRVVIHMHIPSGPEAYYQEAGRAGRDGKKSYSVILFNKSDEKLLKQNFDLSNPELPFLKKLYQGLANYLKVGVGRSENISYDFDLNEFANSFNFDNKQAFFGMNKLESEGLIMLNEPFRNPSQLLFSLDRVDLYRFQVENSKFDPLIKTILRVYGGEIFTQYIRIDEKKIAKALNIDVFEVKKGLNLLQNRQVLDYSEQKDKSQLIFLSQRFDAEKLPVNGRLLKSRRKNEEEKIKTMLAYIHNQQRCRNQILLEYFDELNFNECGICDNCVNNRKRQAWEDPAKYKQQIMHLLESGEMDIEQLEEAIDEAHHEQVEIVIRELLDEGKIVYTPQWKIRRK